uniref:Uncharacterized protein n=1 Tax=Caenorhabditis japonica TaxID=281687 RepID=A0A8R1HW32_CAEJA
MADELQRLRDEIASLTQQLEKANEDLHTAANAGLELLRQKDALERRIAEMQAELEVAKVEVDKANQVGRIFKRYFQCMESCQSVTRCFSAAEMAMWSCS